MARLTFRFRFPVAFTLAALAWGAEPPRPVADAAPEIYTPVPLDQQRLAGLLGGQLRANAEGFLEHVSPEAMLEPFRHRAADVRPEETGESAGLFLIAASNAYEYNDDSHIKTVMDGVAKGLMASQERDGYLGLYTAHARWGSGDVLAQACSLAGLFAYGRVTGNDEAFDAGHHAADLMISTFEKNPETESGDDPVALLEPLAELYRGTGDSRYLAFSKRLLQRHAQPVATSGATILFGLAEAELYRLTANEADLQKAQAAWQAAGQTASVAGAPQLRSTGKVGNGADTCALFFWLELNQDLLRITGNPQYADALETLTYNQLLASQNARTGDIATSTSLDSPVHFAHGDDVCSLAEAAAITEIPGEIWGRYGTGVGVLNYSPGRSTLRLRKRASVQLYTESNFPESGNVLLHVEPTHDTRFPLQLFVPSWTKQFTAEIGATRLSGRPGHFLTITREWKKGDTVKIEIDLTPSVVPDAVQPGRVAIRRGPQLLALSKTLNPQLISQRTIHLSVRAASGLTFVDTASVMPTSETGSQTYTLSAESADQPQDLILVPFAAAESKRIWFTSQEH